MSTPWSIDGNKHFGLFKALILLRRAHCAYVCNSEFNFIQVQTYIWTCIASALKWSVWICVTSVSLLRGSFLCLFHFQRRLARLSCTLQHASFAVLLDTFSHLSVLISLNQSINSIKKMLIFFNALAASLRELCEVVIKLFIRLLDVTALACFIVELYNQQNFSK